MYHVLLKQLQDCEPLIQETQMNLKTKVLSESVTYKTTYHGVPWGQGFWVEDRVLYLDRGWDHTATYAFVKTQQMYSKYLCIITVCKFYLKRKKY